MCGKLLHASQVYLYWAMQWALEISTRCCCAKSSNVRALTWTYESLIVGLYSEQGDTGHHSAT